MKKFTDHKIMGSNEIVKNEREAGTTFHHKINMSEI